MARLTGISIQLCIFSSEVAGQQRTIIENRDLAPTTDLRSVAKGILSAHLGLSAAALDRVFPGSGAAPPMQGLVG